MLLQDTLGLHVDLGFRLVDQRVVAFIERQSGGARCTSRRTTDAAPGLAGALQSARHLPRMRGERPVFHFHPPLQEDSMTLHDEQNSGQPMAPRGRGFAGLNPTRRAR